MPKGFGSENMSAIAMLKPADGSEGIVNFVVETVKKAGPNPCPPTIIGVGIGGTIDKAMVIAKKAIVRKNNQPNKNPKFAALENEILTKINNLGIGPAGLGPRREYYLFGGTHRLPAYSYCRYACGGKCLLSCCPTCRGNITKNIILKLGSKSMKEAIKITTPLNEGKIIQLKAGDLVKITGHIYATRDAAHRKFLN